MTQRGNERAEVRTIAQAVRSAAERHFRRNKTLRNRSLIVSLAFSDLLHLHGVEHSLVGGVFTFYKFSGKVRFGDPEAIQFSRSDYDITEHHAWVEINGQIWDLTLTQFDKSAAAVSVLDSNDPRYRVRDDHASRDCAEIWLRLNGIYHDAEAITNAARAALEPEAAAPHGGAR
mgnify:CR=1 FL=1